MIEAESYFLRSESIHRSESVSAKICQIHEQYPWSSLRYFESKSNYPKWFNRKFTLDLFNDSNQDYMQFVYDEAGSEINNFYIKRKTPPIVGSKKFIDEKLSQVDEARKRVSIPDIKSLTSYPDVENIINNVAIYFNVCKEIIKNQALNKKNIPRVVSIYLSRQIGQLTYQKISEIFSLSYQSVGKTLKRCEDDIMNNSNLLHQVNELIKIIYSAVSNVNT